MKQPFDPFVLRKIADGRIFFVNAKMPFEFFVDLFQLEHAFFVVSALEDGRIAIVPNAMVIPQNHLQAGYGPFDLLPPEFEYVTLKTGTYPVIITAHPVAQVWDWFRKFEMRVKPFSEQTLADFVTMSTEFLPLKPERKLERIPAEPLNV